MTNTDTTGNEGAMREVSKQEFYRVIYDEKLNVHPFSQREHTVWHYLSGGHQTTRIFGRTDGGYASPHGHKTRYFLAK